MLPSSPDVDPSPKMKDKLMAGTSGTTSRRLVSTSNTTELHAASEWSTVAVRMASKAARRLPPAVRLGLQ
ncbi:hypothetical protein ACFWN1_11850 [Streptomyces sp. NPDC058459]|uniref:hypothetical protein n=1 Tax=Streptomyces sp. NPDC058459 TaxID=3346508 RepID=UPI003648C8D3